MANTNNFGVNLSTGKLSFPITLGRLTGPNGFGSTISLNYSTTGLLNQVTTWNEDAPTSIVGLGWSLQAASTIVRSGTGSWQDSFFVMIGSQTIPLLLVKSPLITKDFSTLEFVTQSKSLYKITYDVPSETWTLIDQDGNTCIYGGQGTDAVDLGIRWVSQAGGQPAVWIGSSTEVSGQQNYAVAWRLAQKTSLSGQRVTYTWSQIQQSIAKNADPNALNYTMANYLTRIQVENGTSVSFNYEDKTSNEYPVFRWNAEQPGSLGLGAQLTNGNAFQDRIETKYLASLEFYDINNNLQNTINLGYDFLYQNFNPQPTDVSVMNKRLLTSIETVTAEDVVVAPPQKFDYWGLYDNQLHEQIAKAKLLALSNDDLCIRGIIDYAGAKDGRTYDALFGHLKTIQSPLGALTWYSYADNSETSTSLAGQGWDLRYDLPDDLPPPPSPQGTTWGNPQPYWGNDNYVVIRWNLNIDDGGEYRVAFKIYEWIGKWVPMTIYDVDTKENFTLVESQVCYFPDMPDYFTRVATGSGKFIVACANVELPYNIALFHRDENIPGQWNVTRFSVTTCQGKNELPVVPEGLTTNDINAYYQLCLGVGNNTASLLDVISGTLHLFNLVNNTWVYNNNQGVQITDELTVSSDSPHYPNCCSSLSVVGDDVFVISAQMLRESYYYKRYNISYQLFHYDKTADSENNSWTTSISLENWDVDIIKGFDQPGTDTFIAAITSEVADGFIFVQIVINYAPARTGTTLVGCPVVVTWDDWYTAFNIQQIYSPNDASKYGSSNATMAWGDTLQQTPWIWQGNLSGNIASSNLINISTGTGSISKYVGRYVGGNSVNDSTYNLGWSCNQNLSNLKDNSDPWEQMATYDTTVSINGKSGEDYTYQFNQFQPYTPTNEGPVWAPQSNVKMGYNKDWSDVEHILKEVIFFVNLALQALLLIATFGESAMAEGAIRSITKGIRTTLMLAVRAINNPITHLIERSVFEKVLNNRRMGSGGGQDYLLVGTNMDSNGNPNGGQPNAYYKYWDTANKEWSWVAADPNGLLNSIPVPVIPQIDEGNPVTHCLAADVYRYGSSFIPFSYMSYLEHDVNKPAHEGVVRNFNADQVAFFRNGIMSNLVAMPNFKADSTYINTIYGTIYLPYTFYQGSSDSFTLYAPWGGILAYQPQVYTNYYQGPDNNIWDDLIAEGATGDALWPVDGPIDQYSLPSAPDIQASVSIRLFLAQNQSVFGPLQDFAVNKVSVDDGIQVYDTHISYMSDNATYQDGLDSVVYNQVRIASGGIDYTTAAYKNGWTEYYYYSGSSALLNVSGRQGTAFPFEPATDSSNPFYSQCLSFTNSTDNLNSILGQCYAVRSVKYDSSQPDQSIGIEMSRQYNYYYAVSQMTGVGSQKIQKIFTPLTLTFTAADNAKNPYIQDSTYTSAAVYSFYDVAGLNGSNTLSGLETGLVLSKQSTSNHLTNGIVQNQTQVTANTYGFQTSAYGKQFQNLNLFSPVVQTITSQTPDANPTALQPVSASATIWTSAQDDQQQTYWYPYANYSWSGSSNGSIGNGIPWSATNEQSLQPLTPDWQLSSYVRNMDNGVVLEAVSAQNINDPNSIPGSRSYTLYDSTQTFPVATFSFPNLNTSNLSEISTDMLRFSSFESYEDLSSWCISDSAGTPLNTPISQYITSQNCYAGQQCVQLKYGSFVYCENNLDPTSYPADQVVLSFFYAPSIPVQANTHIRVWLRAGIGGGKYVNLSSTTFPLQSQTPSAWAYQQVLYNLVDLAKTNNVTEKYTLWIGFSCGESNSSPWYLDAVSLMPLSGTGSFQVYDNATWLLKATIDNNGLTTRNVYDVHQRLIGTTQGRGVTQAVTGIPVVYPSLEGRKDNTSSDVASHLNHSLSIQAVNGGQYFDFRCSNDVMGWTGTSLSISNHGLLIPAMTSATQSIANFNWGAGIRVQVNRNGTSISNGTQISLGNIAITCVVDTNNAYFTLTLPNSKVPIPSPLLFEPTQVPGDWLLLVLTNQLYFFANGQTIFSQLSTAPLQTDLTVQLTAGDVATLFSDIMLIQDPVISGSFLDGMGKTRQTQSLAELETLPNKSITVNYSVPIKPPYYFAGLPVSVNELTYLGVALKHLIDSDENGSTYQVCYTVDSLGNLTYNKLPLRKCFALLNTMAESKSLLLLQDKEVIVSSVSQSFTQWTATYPTSLGIILIKEIHSPFSINGFLSNNNACTMPPSRNLQGQVYYIGLNNESNLWSINVIDFTVGSLTPQTVYKFEKLNDINTTNAIVQTPLFVGGSLGDQIVVIMSQYDNKNNLLSYLYKYQTGSQTCLARGFASGEFAMLTPALGSDGQVYVTTTQGLSSSSPTYRLYCIPANFKSVRSVILPAEAAAGPVVVDTGVFVPLQNGTIVQYDTALNLLNTFEVAVSLRGALTITDNGEMYVVGVNNNNQLQAYVLDDKGNFIYTTPPANSYQPQAMIFCPEAIFIAPGATCLSLMPGRYPNACNNDQYDNMYSPTLNNGMNFEYNQDFTLELWVMVDGYSDYQGSDKGYSSILEGYNAANPGSYPFSIRYWPNGDSSGNYKGQLWVSKNHSKDSAPISLYSGNTPINDGKFHHIAVVSQWDAGANGANLCLYIDGVCVDSTLDTSTGSTQNVSIITLGGIVTPLKGGNGIMNPFPQQAFSGAMMEVRIWNYARSIKQINQAKNLRLGRESGLLGYWPLTPDTCLVETNRGYGVVQAKDLISGCDGGSAALKTYFEGWIPSSVSFQQLVIDVSSTEKEDLLTTWDGENLTNISLFK